LVASQGSIILLPLHRILQGKPILVPQHETIDTYHLSVSCSQRVNFTQQKLV
jgi:hypothetical protein